MSAPVGPERRGARLRREVVVPDIVSARARIAAVVAAVVVLTAGVVDALLAAAR